MATKVQVRGKSIQRAGVFATIKSAVKNPSQATSYGNVLIIDDGIGAGFGGGSGINGLYKQGKDAIYSFDDLASFQAFVKGGDLWNLGKALFQPATGQKGASKVFLGQARTTAPAKIAWTFTNGAFSIATKDEGLNANGVLNTNFGLSLGYASKLFQRNAPLNGTATFVTSAIQTLTNPTNETKATANGSVQNVGANGDTFRATVDGSEIGFFIKTSAETTLTAIAAALVSDINSKTATHGYTATNSAGAITATAPTGSGATANGRALQVSRTFSGGNETNGSNFNGGVNGTAGAPQKNRVVAVNINKGDVFNAVVNGVTFTVSAPSTIATDVYRLLVSLISANATVSAAVTPSYTTAGLVLTSVSSAFTSSSSASAAPAEFTFQIWHGNYKGIDALNGIDFGGVSQLDAEATLVVESPVIKTVADLLAFFNSSVDFKDGFVLEAGSTATGSIVVGDIASNQTNGWKLASGGTENYGASDFNEVLSKINNLDFTHILSMKYGDNAKHTNNDKLVDFVKTKSKYDRLVVIAGGFDRSTRTVSDFSSAGIAKYFDCDAVVIVHGGVKKTAKSGFNVYSQLYHAAAILGRNVGLEPQVPVTLKSIGIDGLVDNLEDADQEALITAGVAHSYYDTELGGVFVVGLDITSIQKNDYLINDNGTTYSWQLKRIQADLNKSLVFAGKKRFFDPEGTGGNRNTTSVEEVTEWATKVFFPSKTANSKADNLIIEVRDVVATLNQDNINLQYSFVPNTEVKTIVATGTMIEG